MKKTIFIAGLTALAFVGIQIIRLHISLNELEASISELNTDIEALRTEADRL